MIIRQTLSMGKGKEFDPWGTRKNASLIENHKLRGLYDYRKIGNLHEKDELLRGRVVCRGGMQGASGISPGGKMTSRVKLAERSNVRGEGRTKTGGWESKHPPVARLPDEGERCEAIRLGKLGEGPGKKILRRGGRARRGVVEEGRNGGKSELLRSSKK